MKVARLLALAFVLQAAPALAADWWWIGSTNEGQIVSYVDRETLRPIRGDEVEMWVLNIRDTPNVLGARAQAMQYRYRCRQRTLSMQRRIAYDGNGDVMPLADPPPEEFTRAVAGSMGETALNFACGRPAGIELRVADAIQHAVDYFASRTQRTGATAGNAPAPASPSAPPAAEAPAEPSNLSVGTGFFIGPAGTVLTSYHVVEGARRIACRTPDGRFHDASVVRMSQANDLALLQVAHRPARYLTFAPPGTLRPGDRVFTLGYGAVNYLGTNEPRFSDGAVSALSGLGAEDAYMQITVPVQPGNSGGPLLNEAGHVVGIVAAQAAVDAFLRAEGTLPQSINWAVKSEYASPLLPPMQPAARRTREEAIDVARNAICLIVASTAEE